MESKEKNSELEAKEKLLNQFENNLLRREEKLKKKEAKIINGEKNNWRQDLKNWIYKYLVAILIILSLVLIILSLSNIIKHTTINETLSKTGFAILSSGVFAAVLKSIQFTGIFKKEIEETMLDTKFIENRADISGLWKSISQSIYKRKFPRINEELENRILSTYFPTNSDYYYEDYVVTINIEKITKDFELVYTQTCKYTVILEKNLDRATLTLKTSIDDVNGSKIVNTLEFFKVDDIDQDPQEDPETAGNPF